MTDDLLGKLMREQQGHLTKAKALDGKIKSEKEKRKKKEIVALVEDVKDFGAEFREGVIAKRWGKISTRGKLLSDLDSKWYNGFGDKTSGVEFKDKEEAKFFTHLFGNCLYKQPTLAKLLGYISAKEKTDGNIFFNGDK